MLYNGIQCDAGDAELLAYLPDEWSTPEEDEAQHKELDYVEWLF